MSRYQRGILAEANLHSLYLLFNAVDGVEEDIRHHLARFHKMITRYDNEYSESELSAFVAVGANYWDQLYPDARPKLLVDFPEIPDAIHHAPNTPYDLFVHIRSDRADVNHLVGSQICDLLGDSVRLAEQVKGFRFLDGRDLTGFVDGTENPHGGRRRDVAIVKDDDEKFIGGSYIHIQRYRHKLDLWKELPVTEQEDIIGRTKADDVEYPSEDKADFAHTKRTSLKDEAGNSIEILRQSMPYGTMKIQGLFFVSCCHTPTAFNLMLESMLVGENGHYDHLLNYTEAETGAAFFAPSIDFLTSYSS